MEDQFVQVVVQLGDRTARTKPLSRIGSSKTRAAIPRLTLKRSAAPADGAAGAFEHAQNVHGDSCPRRVGAGATAASRLRGSARVLNTFTYLPRNQLAVNHHSFWTASAEYPGDFAEYWFDSPIFKAATTGRARFSGGDQFPLARFTPTTFMV